MTKLLTFNCRKNIFNINFLILPFSLYLTIFTSQVNAQEIERRIDFTPINSQPPTKPLSPDEIIPQTDNQDILQPLPQQNLQENISNGPTEICIKEFTFKGNTVFSQAELNKIIKEQLNITSDNNQCFKLTFNQVIEARSIITRYYLENNYPAAFAYIPENQEVALVDGTITMNIIEGKIEKIKITGLKRLNQNYIKSRLTRGNLTPLNQEQLIENLLLLQRNPLISKINAELSTGFTVGGVILEVAVEEANTFNIQAKLDNNRSPSVGSFRRAITISEGNLLGLGDNANVSYKNTDGSNELEVNYGIPLNSNDGTLSFKYRLSSSEVIEEPFDKLDIHSDYRNYELSFRQPIIRNVNENKSEEFVLGFNFSRQESDNYLLGQRFPVSIGADENGETKISALRFSQEYTNRGINDVFLARSEFSVGVDLFDVTTNDGVDPLSKTQLPDNNFFLWRGQVQWLHLLDSDTIFLLRSGMQFADRPILSLEQFGYGGFYTVRGYRQDARLTDNGIFATAELQFPLYSDFNNNHLLSIHPFLDVGTGWNSGRDNPNQKTLVGIGFGLQWRTRDRFKARIDWGIPLIDINSGDQKTWQENGVYFTVEYNFF